MSLDAGNLKALNYPEIKLKQYKKILTLYQKLLKIIREFLMFFASKTIYKEISCMA